MKISALFYVLFAATIFVSCKNSEEKKEAKEAKEKVEEIVSATCYKAVYENDTIDLKVNTLKSGKVSGDLVMKIYAMPKKIGEIYGDYHGDTLLVSYTFIDEGNEKVTYKNPMAFLKKDSLLILGNGKMETSMGATYFVKGEPIDFENVKYKFSTVDCVGK
ncbi:hypothetical protein SAMN05192550_0847 [Flavobacterium glycines]|uniref:Lipoprotein n=1 Tax=Flavobacterium glycines TaxID=551990 RepID=A0A1B9DSF4_9FLAO|nr:hypothetical protein [Flavobacterium glycines]OCB72629.1 hypothetical protein FBGL_08315 [Flavobacterium glycines]GEL10129.1 hypothetical protein FGL01_08680 [Flavobacterium glycines]SDI80223.1 hypothetical protein SAMN05192550_0847 [Flavobacterium glycines]